LTELIPKFVREIAIEARNRVVRKYPGGCLSGKNAFMLHDTYGLPFDYMREACRDRNAYFDLTGLRLELKYNYNWPPERIEAELQ
jgi:alanyl-tRNA synthetase